jgi:hypothetical protein
VEFATTWNTGGVCRGETDYVRQRVRDFVDEFCNDYLKMNPKK